jgi:putative hydrolases of HD superfamily
LRNEPNYDMNISGVNPDIFYFTMKNSLNFLVKTNKLKEVPRTGWVLMRVKNPETIAEHIFRVVVMSWVLGMMKGLNTKKIIKIALCHDLSEVYAGDITPFFYWEGLDRKKKSEEKILLKGVRLSSSEKERMGKIKFGKEKNSILKLASFLKPEMRSEIIGTWLEYEKKTSPEAIFVKQIDIMETLLQSIEYFHLRNIPGGTSWWEMTEEVVEDKLLLDFLKIVQNKFYKKKFKADKKLEGILDFILKIGELKRMPREYWLLRGLKNSETVAGHIFTLSLMVLIFGRNKKQLNSGKLLKMAFCHELSAVYTKDTTPYGRSLPKNKKELEKLLEKAPYFSEKNKIKRFSDDYKEEKRAMERLTANLSLEFRKEIMGLWDEYRNRSTPEGRFLSQLNVLAILFQGLLYRKQKKGFSVSALWEWLFEVCDDPLGSALADEMKKRLHKTK